MNSYRPQKLLGQFANIRWLRPPLDPPTELQRADQHPASVSRLDHVIQETQARGTPGRAAKTHLFDGVLPGLLRVRGFLDLSLINHVGRDFRSHKVKYHAERYGEALGAVVIDATGVGSAVMDLFIAAGTDGRTDGRSGDYGEPGESGGCGGTDGGGV
jgi:hypothetical protein